MEKMNEQLYQARRRCAPPFLRYLQKNLRGGGAEINPPPGCARVNLAVTLTGSLTTNLGQHVLPNMARQNPSPHARFIARSVCEPGQVAGEECGLHQVSGGGAPSSPRWGFSQGTDLPTVGEPGRGNILFRPTVQRIIMCAEPACLYHTIGPRAVDVHHHDTRRAENRTLSRIRTEAGRRRLCHRGSSLLNKRRLDPAEIGFRTKLKDAMRADDT